MKKQGMNQVSEIADKAPWDAAIEPVITVESIRVLTGRMICDIRIQDPRWCYSTPELMSILCRELPDLPYHACVNENGHTFNTAMNKTSLAHVLEHVIISLQVRASTDDAASFQGTTEWTDEARGSARVQVGFQDDLVALRSFNEALTLINNAVIICSA